MKYILSFLLCCFVFGCLAPDAEPGIDSNDECLGFVEDVRCCAYCSDVLAGIVSVDYLCDDTISKYKWELLATNGCNECPNGCEQFLCINKSVDQYKPDTGSVCFKCVESSPQTTEYFHSCQDDRSSK